MVQFVNEPLDLHLNRRNRYIQNTWVYIPDLINAHWIHGSEMFCIKETGVIFFSSSYVFVQLQN